jgi:hypothetical protein
MKESLETTKQFFMTTSKIITGLIIVFSFFSCSQAKHDDMEQAVLADSLSNGFISSSAAVESNKDTTRKFIRTADLKFKVKSVIQSTYDIEETTNRQGGFVTFTNLTSQIDNITTTPVSADSSLETTHYTVTNSIILRVPNTHLDTTLKEISKNIDFLDYRIIKAQDVALQVLSNKLTQRRSAQNEERLINAIDNRGKKLKETTSAEELLWSKQEQADNARISNLSLADEIKFSTINLSIYQRQTIKRELISNDKNIDAYEPGFGSKLLESFKYGWRILESFLILLARLWALFLFGLIGYLVVRRYGYKFKKR